MVEGINNETAHTWHEREEIVYGVMHLVSLPEVWEKQVNRRLDAMEIVLNLTTKR